MKVASLILSLLLLLPVSVTANIDVYEFSSDEKRMDYISLTKELRCPKCQNQDIADSNAPIASDMRREVHRLLEEGKERDQIISFMVERFGDFVTYKPKLSQETYVLWFGPWIFIAIGVLIIGFAVRKRVSVKKPPNEAPNKGAVKPEERKSSDKVEALLKEFDSQDKQDKS